MKKHGGKTFSAIITAVLVVGLAAAISAKDAAAEEIVAVKGLLTTEKCLREPVCYLEWFDSDRSSLALFTAKRTVYKLETGGLPAWKLSSGFGKQVVVKGIVKGGKIIVSDVVSLAGSGKISKSCL